MSRLRLSLCAVLLIGMQVAPALHVRADDVPLNQNAVVYNTNGSGLRMRAGPSTSQPVVVTVPEGAQVMVLEGPTTDSTGQDWYRVSYNGQSGWVAGSFLGVPGTVPVTTSSRGLAAPGAPVSAAPAGLAPPPAAAPAPSPAPALTSALSAPSPTPVTTATTTTSGGSARSAPAAAPPKVVGGRPSGAAITQVAISLIGSPYAWSGKTPAGFDCAGFVLYVYAQFGISLPPTTYDQWAVGRPVAREDLLIGDLVFFANTYEPGISHVGIYVGDNAFVHAENDSTGVVRSSLTSGYWASKYYGARRVLD